jgi:dihydropteroate synthase-like protein
MAEHLLFLTGHLAHDSLCRELESLSNRDFSYRVHDLGIKVAALMTADMIRRRLPDIMGANRIIVPGLCSGRVTELTEHFGVPVEKGPIDLKDLPEYFGVQGRTIDLTRYHVRIFAEIVDATQLSIDAIIERAQRYRHDGANVIDLGCLPETPFPHMEESIQALQDSGFEVSVDSLETAELLRAGRAGADYLLSLKESTLWIADEVDSTPVLIPDNGTELDSLCRAIDKFSQTGRPFFADPIIEPLHFGFTASLVRYYELRQRLPEVPVMMGTGNITELTDADTTGMTALLMGIISELDIAAILTTEVSPHCVSAVREADLARRMLFAAKNDNRLPRGYHQGLMALRDRKPFPYSRAEISRTAAEIKDSNFRIQLSADGIHIYNRDGLHAATDPFALYPHLNVEHDGAHAFYLGVELARAQIAWQLGKRYLQDNELHWGSALPERPDNSAEGYKPAGPTLKARRS